MVRIFASVGDRGANRRPDVLVVQTLLNARNCYTGALDGICGMQTVAAIRKFQQTIWLRPDGLIQPGHTTWVKLSSISPLLSATVRSIWSGDSSQWPEQKKLQSMHANLSAKVSTVLAALRQRKFQPKVFYGWRSVAVQLELYNKGTSTVKFSFHNAQRRDGTPNSYAADIIDSRYGWSDEAEKSGFWKALGEEAKKQGLYWGGDWSSFRDWAHVQLVPNSQLAVVKLGWGPR